MLTDVFKVKGNQIVGIEDEDEVLDYLKRFKKDKQGNWVFQGDEKSYAVANDVIAKINELKKTNGGNKEFDEGSFREVFHKLGGSAALRGVLSWKNLIGKSTKPQDLINATNQIDFNEVYNIAFENKNLGVIKDEFANKPPYEVMENIAARVAVKSLKENGKIDDQTYNKLVVNENGTEKFRIDDIKNDQATREKYAAVKNNFNNAFEEGVMEMQEKLKKNEGNIVDPITNQKIKDPSMLAKGMELAGSIVGKVGGKIGEIVGVTENSPDIYSKMIFAAIGGGKKLWANLKNMAATKRFREMSKVKVKDLKKKVSEAIEKAKPMVEEEKKNGGKPAEEKPKEEQDGVQP